MSTLLSCEIKEPGVYKNAMPFIGYKTARCVTHSTWLGSFMHNLTGRPFLAQMEYCVLKVQIPINSTIVCPYQSGYGGFELRTDQMIPIGVKTKQKKYVNAILSSWDIRPTYEYKIGVVNTPVQRLDRSLERMATSGLHFHQNEEDGTGMHIEGKGFDLFD